MQELGPRGGTIVGEPDVYVFRELRKTRWSWSDLAVGVSLTLVWGWVERGIKFEQLLRLGLMADIGLDLCFDSTDGGSYNRWILFEW
mgnify:CR=1 FL=1